MKARGFRMVATVIIAALAALAVHASGGTAQPEPTTPELTPEQLADQFYNEGLVYRDKAWKFEEELAAAAEADRAKLEKRIEKNYTRAIASFEDALRNNPNLYQAASSLGYALRKTGEYDDALAAYDHALSIQPNYAEAIEYRAEAYLGLNRIDEAKESYLTLFGSDRPRADELLAAMQRWLAAPPQSVDGATVESFRAWVDERAEIAGNTAPVSQLGEKSW
ncbi:MAG TPA: tetratricopeptide repeat protein [Candidatus Polarisedimenticolaceae bacterium]|nr:tetratricopeptide repeat protein [Candidatus Polarisedimenticolaceae bacterium]